MWGAKNSKTNGGAWSWFSPAHNWKGHQGNYANWLKKHPECDESKEGYDVNADTCLAEEKEAERKEDQQWADFENESIADELDDEWTYLGDELQNEYDVQEIRQDYWQLSDNFTLPNFLGFVVAIKWVFLVLFLGIPWVIFSQLCVIYNIVFNAWLNEGWAEGNFWLLFNTWYAIVQTWMSYGIVLEIYPLMKYGILFRIMSFISAWIYNTVYFIGLIAWGSEMIMLPLQDDDYIDEISVIDVVMNMLFVYNSIQHSPICFINIVIILKEIQIWLYEFATGGDNYYALSWQEGRQSFWDNSWYFDPLRIIPWVMIHGFKFNLKNAISQFKFLGIE